MHIFLRIDQLGEYSIREHFTYINVLVEVGGISQSVFIPFLLILNYFTSLRFTASIISRLFTKKQSVDEFLNNHQRKNDKPCNVQGNIVMNSSEVK